VTAPAEAAPAPLRLVLVPTPQPPLAAEPPTSWVRTGVPVPRRLHRPGPRPSTGTPDPFGPVWSSRAELPDPRVAGRQLLTTALEAFAGRRPISQLQPLTTARVFTALSSGRRPAWCAGGSAPVVLGAVNVCEPVDGVAEVSAVARRSGRAHAVAARLEGIDGRWRCTAVQIG
jgi:Family of unknown function (DUF6459)